MRETFEQWSERMRREGTPLRERDAPSPRTSRELPPTDRRIEQIGAAALSAAILLGMLADLLDWHRSTLLGVVEGALLLVAWSWLAWSGWRWLVDRRKSTTP